MSGAASGVLRLAGRRFGAGSASGEGTGRGPMSIRHCFVDVEGLVRTARCRSPGSGIQRRRRWLLLVRCESDAFALVALKLMFQFGNFVAGGVLLLGGLQGLHEVHDFERERLHELHSLIALVWRIVRVKGAGCPIDVDFPASQGFED